MMCHQNKADCAGDEVAQTQDVGGAEGASRKTTTAPAGVLSFVLMALTIDGFFV